MDKTIHTDGSLFLYNNKERPFINQLLLAMKLFLILLAISLQVSAAALSQEITLSATKAPLREVMQSIRKQSGYQFIIESSYLDIAKPVSVVLKAVSIEEALEKVFAEQPFGYVVKNRTVVVKEKVGEQKKTLISSDALITITGRVTDSDNKPLVGVSVRVKGTNSGTISNQDGNYNIAAASDDVLIFSYVGYLTAEMPVKGRAGIDIQLEAFQSRLEETVVKGYYNTTTALNTGNVSSVKAAEIANQPISDPLATLQGKIPGLFIQQNSGATGRAFTVQLRGKNSIANGNDPLYIVDGIPFNSTPLNTIYLIGGAGQNTSPLNDINPSDIESIDVLKDADATAIYGSRGANGVILITTKKGKVGKTEFNFNAYSGTGKVSRKLDLMNTNEYLQMRQTAFKNDNTSPGALDYDLNGTFDKSHFIDWQKVLIGGTARVTNFQSSISGGNKNTQFRIGGGHRNENSVYPGDQGSKKSSALISFHNSSDNNKLDINFTGNYVSSSNRLPIIDLTTLIFLAPNSPDIYDSNGNLNWENSTWDNPFTNILQRNIEKTNNLIGSVQISYQILKSLHLKINAGYNKVELSQNVLTPFSAFDPAYIESATLLRSNLKNNNKISNWITEPQLGYSHSLWIGNLEGLLGITFQETSQESLSEYAYGFSTDNLIGNLAAGSLTGINENVINQYRYNAIYARFGYNILDKYILNLTGRRDGSSRFGPGKQFGYFGSIGAAWVFSKEAFVHDNLRFLSFGKIRGSIGSTGNDKLTDYQYLSTYSTYNYNYQGLSGLQPTQLTNPYFGWERVNKIELSVDLGFLKDRIILNTAIYRNRTSNQLVGYSLPIVTGFQNIQANLPAIIENKGFEFELNTVNIDKSNFRWTTSANMSIPRNKLISYPNLQASTYSSRYFIGQSLFIQNKYVYTGINSETGLYTFQDKDGDEVITSKGDRSPVLIGQYFYGGISNSFKYKSLRLDILISYCKQKGLELPFNTQPGLYLEGNGNQPRSIVDNRNIQPLSQDYSNNILAQNTLYLNSNGIIGDASYMRLKNFALSWTLPEQWGNMTGFLKNCSVYIQCQNLFTITNYKGLDPETQSGVALTLPTLRVITAGLSFTL